jgi:pimeloyl-ACP methyl ester carboxylesterase
MLQAIIDDAKPAQLEVELSSRLSPRIRDEIQSPVPEAEKKEVSASMKMKIAAMLKLQEQPEIVHLAEDKGPKSAPLFLIHDGSGICVQYHRLRPFNRTVYAIHDPKFLDPDSWSGIPAMAQSYAQLIARTTSGPYILGGWSFGGVVAFEAARVLMAGGYAVAGVVLIDSPPPIDHKPLSANIIDAVTKVIEIEVAWSVKLFETLSGKASPPARVCLGLSNRRLRQVPVDQFHGLSCSDQGMDSI